MEEVLTSVGIHHSRILEINGYVQVFYLNPLNARRTNRLTEEVHC